MYRERQSLKDNAGSAKRQVIKAIEPFRTFVMGSYPGGLIP